jgi:ABC-type transport system substrate-binding protein
MKGELEKNMNLKSRAISLALLSALILTTFNMLPANSQIDPPIVGYPSGPFEKFGPRVDKLTFKVAGSSSIEADLLEAGELDMMDWGAPGARWSAWLADPDITMGEYSELSMIYFALNVQRWPLGHGDQLAHGWSNFPAGYKGGHTDAKWPTEWGGTAEKMWMDYDNCQRCNDSRWYRRGLSHLLDRTTIVGTIVGVTGMETLIMPAITATWEDPTVPKYAYSHAQAQVCFANGGFLDYDEDGWLEYSPSHAADPPGPTGPVDMEEVPSLQIYIRADDPDRQIAGLKFAEDLDLAGVPNDDLIRSNTECSIHAWQNYDYDIYIEYWDWGVPLPDIYYEGFHSDKDLTDVYYGTYEPTPSDPQYVAWSDGSARFHDMDYDVQADLFKNSLTGPAALPYAFAMQQILHGDAIVIPLYTYVGFQGHSTNYVGPESSYTGLQWEGFNNEPGLGFYSYWTMLNAHPQGFERGFDDECTLRHGLVNDVVDMNILKTWWFYDLQVLGQIYEGLIVVDPLDQTNYVPWLCESYNVGTWDKPGGGTGSAINFTLIPDILFQDGVAMTAEDVAFSIEHFRNTQAVSYFPTVEKIDSTVIHSDTPETGKETIEIRFKDQSWLAIDWASILVVLPKHIWEGKAPEWDPVANDAVIGTGPFRFYKDGVVGRVNRVLGQFVYLEKNPLYFRKLVRPDFYPQPLWPTWSSDGTILSNDFLTAVGQFGTAPPIWHSQWGPLADVNKDLVVDIDDLMEIAVRYGETGYNEGYPSYYT